VPVGPVQKSTWVVVQVSGQYTATPNPACGTAPPNWPCILNPPASSFYAPAPFSSGPVQAWVASGGTSAIPLRGTAGAANTAGQAVGLYFAPAAGTLMIRSAVENYITPNPNPGAQVSSWIISGTYNATATKISNPLTFSGSLTGAPDGTVTFTVGTTAPLLFINPNGVPASSPPGDVDWYIVPGDAVPLTYERTSPAYQIFACYRKNTCTYTPPPNLNGRMQVAAYVEGQLVIGRSDYVRNAAPCLPGGSGCTDGPRLQVTCQPSGPVRGDTVSCRSWVTPAQPFTVTRREAVAPRLYLVDSIPHAYASGEVDVWRGPAITKTRVIVQVTITGQTNPLRGRAEFDPNPRPWPAYNITNPRVDTLVDRASMEWVPSDSTAYGGTYLYPLDIHHTPLFRATTGPNAGLAMLGAQPLYRDPHIAHIYLHPAIFNPAADTAWTRWNNDQNGTPSGTCPQSKMPQLRIEAARHEGATVAPNSHVGVANHEFQSSKPQLKMEEFYTIAAASDSTVRFGAMAKYNEWYSHDYWPAQAAFDATDRPLIWITILACQLDNNATNP
jgi:hypothetical protein